MFQYLNNNHHKNIQHHITTITINIMHILLPILYKESIIRETFTNINHEKHFNKKEDIAKILKNIQHDYNELIFLFLFLTTILGSSIYILPKYYTFAALTYLMLTPPTANLCLMPTHNQQDSIFMMNIIRQYIIHTPIATIFLIGIEITRTKHQMTTAILFFELTQFTLFACCYQYVLSVSKDTHQKYQDIVNNMSHHKYIQHIRETQILITPKPRHRFMQTIILPTYTDTIKKMRYIRTITQK